jgi:hypothetical protein
LIWNMPPVIYIRRYGMKACAVTEVVTEICPTVPLDG